MVKGGIGRIRGGEHCSCAARRRLQDWVRRAVAAWGLGAGGRGGSLATWTPLCLGAAAAERGECEMRDGETERERLGSGELPQLRLRRSTVGPNASRLACGCCWA